MEGRNLANAPRAEAHPPPRPGELALRTFDALWRSRYLVLLSGLLAGLACFLFLSIRKPVYEARATLLVQPPSFSTELKPKPLSIETYQSILKSDFVVSKLLLRLIQEQVLPPHTPRETLEDRLVVEIMAHRETDRPGARDYMPLLNLIATAAEPDQAAEIANTWADVFLAENDGLQGQLKQSSLAFIESQYPEVSNTLKERESQLLEREDYYGKGLLDLRKRLEMQILKAKEENARERSELLNTLAQEKLDYENETARLTSEYERETERLKLEFLNRWKPELLKKDLRIKTDKMADLKSKVLEVDLEIKTQRDTLELLKRETEKQPQFLVLSKAITDEALWDRIGSEPSEGLLEKLKELQLRTEEINPAYTNLLSRVIDAQITYEALGPKREHLLAGIKTLQEEVDQLSDVITEKEIAIEDLTRSRELGLSQLVRDRGVGLVKLDNDQRAELEAFRERSGTKLQQLEAAMKNDVSSLTRERDVMVGQLLREKESVQKTYGILAEKYEAAHLARAEAVSDITLGGRAIVPERPLPSGRLKKTALALLAGFLVSALIILSLEYLRFIRVANPPTAAPRAEAAEVGLKSAAR